MAASCGARAVAAAAMLWFANLACAVRHQQLAARIDEVPGSCRCGGGAVAELSAALIGASAFGTASSLLEHDVRGHCEDDSDPPALVPEWGEGSDDESLPPPSRPMMVGGSGGAEFARPGATLLGAHVCSGRPLDCGHDSHIFGAEIACDGNCSGKRRKVAVKVFHARSAVKRRHIAEVNARARLGAGGDFVTFFGVEGLEAAGNGTSPRIAMELADGTLHDWIHNTLWRLLKTRPHSWKGLTGPRVKVPSPCLQRRRLTSATLEGTLVKITDGGDVTVRLSSSGSLVTIVRRRIFECLTIREDRQYTEKFLLERNIKLFVQMLRGVSHMASLGIVHFDLKPRNVLVKCVQNECHAMLADFAMSCQVEDDGDVEVCDPATMRGSPVYVAPELWSRYSNTEEISEDHLPERRRALLRSDVWSIALVAFELFAGAMPEQMEEFRWLMRSREPTLQEYANFIGEQSTSLTRQKYNPATDPRLSRLPPELVTLLKGLLQREPSKRLTAAEALEAALKIAADLFVQVPEPMQPPTPECWRTLQQ